MVVKIKDKEYTIKYTRETIVKAEKAYNISLLRMEANSTEEIIKFIEALLYGALILNHPEITVNNMGNILDDFLGKDGFEMEGLTNDLVKLIGDVLNPTGGGRRKSLLEK